MKFKETGMIFKLSRVNMGMTQKELGDLLNINSQFISNFERGLCALPLHNMKLLMKIYKEKKIDHKPLCEAYVEDYKREATEKYLRWISR